MLPGDESEVDYYGRRAMEESRAAGVATCPRIGAAHRRMAAAYVARMRAEQRVTAEFDDLLDTLADDDENFNAASGGRLRQ